MSNDMKLIMEEWRRTINEITPELVDDPETGSKIAQDIGKSVDVDLKSGIVKVWDDFFSWYDRQGDFLRIMIDIFGPVVGTAQDFRQLNDDYKKWEEWYLLDYDDPAKFPGPDSPLPSGEELLFNALVSAALIFPAFELAGGIYKEVKKRLGTSSLSKLFGRNFEKLIVLSLGAGGLAGSTLKYAELAPNRSLKLDKKGMPITDKLPRPVAEKWMEFYKVKQKRGAKMKQKAIDAINKLKEYEKSQEKEVVPSAGDDIPTAVPLRYGQL